MNGIGVDRGEACKIYGASNADEFHVGLAASSGWAIN